MRSAVRRHPDMKSERTTERVFFFVSPPLTSFLRCELRFLRPLRSLAKVRWNPASPGVVAHQPLRRIEPQQRVAIQQLGAGYQERCRIAGFRVPPSRILDEVEPGDRHRDVKLLRHAFRGRESTEPFEQPALGFFAPVPREIENRQPDVIRMRERWKRCCFETLNQLVVRDHLYSLACWDPGSGIRDSDAAAMPESSGPEAIASWPQLLLQRARARRGRGFGPLPIGETLSPGSRSK